MAPGGRKAEKRKPKGGRHTGEATVRRKREEGKEKKQKAE